MFVFFSITSITSNINLVEICDETLSDPAVLISDSDIVFPKMSNSSFTVNMQKYRHLQSPNTNKLDMQSSTQI